jgi:cysteinyl-tRNA synthetase
MERNEEFYKNLVLLLKMFKNRPYHLAKYLIENGAFNLDFINKVEKSGKLNELSKEESQNPKNLNVPIVIHDISKMLDFYDSLIDELSQIEKQKSPEELEIELNQKLDNLIKTEKFEEASKVRDYMQKNGVKRVNKF